MFDAPSRDAEGFEEAFPELWARSLGAARRVLGDSESARDAAAEALGRTLVRWKKVRDLPYLDAWVLRVTINSCLDVLRRTKRDARVVEWLARDNAAPVIDVAGWLDLAEAVVALPKRQREVVALRYFADLTESQVAAALGVSVGSVQQHAHRALRTLRARIALPDLGDETVAPT